jgi:putative membrane protein
VREFVLRILATALGLWAATEIVPGIGIEGWPSFFLAALLLGIANAVVRPVVVFLTLPLTLLTLGLFLLVVNGLMLALVAALMDRFWLDGPISAVLGAIVVSLTSWFISLFTGAGRRGDRWRADREARTAGQP